MPKKLTRTLEFTLKFSNPGKLRELEEFAADHVGALNILSRFYEELEVPHVGGIRNG